jgi:hypothetical protein
MGEDILDDTFCQFSGALILFLYHPDTSARGDISSVSSVHLCVQSAPLPPSALIWISMSITQLSTDFQVKIDGFLREHQDLVNDPCVLTSGWGSLWGAGKLDKYEFVS